MTNFAKIVEYVRSLSVWLKAIVILIAAGLAAVLAFSSCTSTRSMSVSVDKAEKVDIHLTDSISSVYPTF